MFCRIRTFQAHLKWSIISKWWTIRWFHLQQPQKHVAGPSKTSRFSRNVVLSFYSIYTAVTSWMLQNS